MQVEGIMADHQSFWLAILLNEGIEDWCIVQAEDGYCWLSEKIIQLPNDASDSLFLHEVAHALCPDPEPYGEGQHYHGSTWASKYGELVEKYLQRRCLQELKPEAAPEECEHRGRSWFHEGQPCPKCG